MVESNVTLNNIKIELLNLYVELTNNTTSYSDYFNIFQRSVFKYFQIKNITFFKYKKDFLWPIDTSLGVNLFRDGIKCSDISPLLENKTLTEITPELRGLTVFSAFDQILFIRKPDNELFGVIAFETTPLWEKFRKSPDISEFIIVISKLFLTIFSSIELRLNEAHYRNLYKVTDLFYSTMDTDKILENIITAIEENFPSFKVELILSNDQDRQTNLKIKQFDYLSERPATIEAFVSGEITVEHDEFSNEKILNTPIKGKQATYGILQVKSPLDFIYTVAQKKYIRMLAQASGNALENAKLYNQSHRLIADLQMINETSHRLNSNLKLNEMFTYLQKQLMKSFKPMECAFVYKEETYKLTNAATELFISGSGQIYLDYVENHFEQSQESIFIADVTRLFETDVQFKSIMATPMIVQEKIMGYCIVLHEQSYYFSFDSFKLMQSLIHHSSLAISNSILRDRLQEMVNKDHLTSLYTRRYLDRYIENAIKQDDKGMFLLIDIDNFKLINDTFGHQTGDEVLVQIAENLNNIIGTRGICARWGGEELAVYIPNILKDEALKMADQIVKTMPLMTSPKVTLSGGLVLWEKAQKIGYDEIFANADKALYCAKNNGKNRFCLFKEEMHLQM